MLSTVEKSLSKSVNENPCWALLLGVHVGEGECPHMYSAVDDTQGRRRRKQGREKGRQTRLPLWANGTWGARPARGRPRSEQDGPCNQRTQRRGRGCGFVSSPRHTALYIHTKPPFTTKLVTGMHHRGRETEGDQKEIKAVPLTDKLRWGPHQVFRICTQANQISLFSSAARPRGR